MKHFYPVISRKPFIGQLIQQVIHRLYFVINAGLKLIMEVNFAINAGQSFLLRRADDAILHQSVQKLL